MNDQPKPTTVEFAKDNAGFEGVADEHTGEWTPSYLDSFWVCDCETALSRACKAINAALAAAYEKGKQDGRDESEISIVEGPVP